MKLKHLATLFFGILTIMLMTISANAIPSAIVTTENGVTTVTITGDVDLNNAGDICTTESGITWEASKLMLPAGKSYKFENIVSCEVDNKGNIIGGTFKGSVTNFGTIESGTFSNTVNNSGGFAKISGGTFNGYVKNNNIISGGIFNDTASGTIAVENYGTISGGTFKLLVYNQNFSEISGGTFTATVNNKNYAEISDGTFTVESIVSNGDAAKITGGTFAGAVNNSSTVGISNGTFSGTVTHNSNAKFQGGKFKIGSYFINNGMNIVSSDVTFEVALNSTGITAPVTVNYGATSIKLTPKSGYALPTGDVINSIKVNTAETTDYTYSNGTITFTDPIAGTVEIDAKSAIKITTSLTADQSQIDFGRFLQSETPITKEFEVTNGSNIPVTLVLPTSEIFTFATDKISLEIGEKTTISVTFPMNLNLGGYVKTVSVNTLDNNTSLDIKLSLIIYSDDDNLQIDNASLGSKPLGTPFIDPTTIKYTSTSTEEITLPEIIVSENLVVTEWSSNSLKNGESATFTALPKADLPVGKYSETVKFGDKTITITLEITAVEDETPTTPDNNQNNNNRPSYEDFLNIVNNSNSTPTLISSAESSTRIIRTKVTDANGNEINIKIIAKKDGKTVVKLDKKYNKQYLNLAVKNAETGKFEIIQSVKITDGQAKIDFGDYKISDIKLTITKKKQETVKR